VGVPGAEEILAQRILHLSAAPVHQRGQQKIPTILDRRHRDEDDAARQAFLRELGVDEPIDYEKTRFEDVVHDVDVVLDTLGGDSQNRSWKVLKKGGILVSVVAPPSADEAAKHGVRSAFFSAQPSSSRLSEIAKLVDAGKLKPVVETVLPLSDARRAHELNETGHARGKIVLKVA